MKKLIMAFTCSGDGDPQPCYIWVTMLLIIIMAMLIMRILGQGEFSDTLILGAMGFVATWLAIYNVGRKWSQQINPNGGSDADKTKTEAPRPGAEIGTGNNQP